jgi:predicted nucleotidyltransferase
MSELEGYKQLILPVLKRYLIKRAAFFGSLAKNNMSENSDIDLLIEPPEANFTLFKMLSLEMEITDLTNRKVDLVEFSALKASIKGEVLSSAISIL